MSSMRKFETLATLAYLSNPQIEQHMPPLGMRDQERKRRSWGGDVVWLVVVLVQGEAQRELDRACYDRLDGEVCLVWSIWWEGG